MRCRKNQSTLTANERARFVAAVLALKANGTYDRYVQTHVDSMMAMPVGWAHRGPAFLPWHREFLRRFDLDLQGIDPSVTLPYWDWTVDNSPTSSVWNDDFMGGNGRPSDGVVTTGPFAGATGNWNLAIDGPFLRRRFGISAPALPTPADVANALSTTPYDMPPYNAGSSLAGFRNTVEGWRNGPQLHNLVHVWVGGSMGPASSPNDPVFFLNHCFEDKLWADWQALHPTETYVPAAGAPVGHKLTDPMEPWASQGTVVTPASMLNHQALGYAYDTEGICLPRLQTIKFLDDGFATLKIGDDGHKFKFVDDHHTLKFADDTGTLKLIDDGMTIKLLDDGGTIKAVDDVKNPGFDIGSQFVPPEVSGASSTLQPAGASPFILSTPHHSFAWTRTFPGSLEATMAQLKAQLAEYKNAIMSLEERRQRGDLNESEAGQLEALQRDVAGVLREYEQLSDPR